MKKIISLLLCIILISGCDKQLNKSQPAKTDNKIANRVNPSPSPSPSPSSLPTPKSTFTPKTHEDTHFSDDEAVAQFDGYLSGVFQWKNWKEIVLITLTSVALILGSWSLWKEPAGFYISSRKAPLPLTPITAPSCWETLKSIGYKLLYPFGLGSAAIGLYSGLHHIDITQDKAEEEK
jgi:hypothetical protein